MYQTTIRNKKVKKILKNNIENQYVINEEEEEYAYVIKMLGNCRVLLVTNSGNECVGIIRGSLRKFINRVLIENGDIVVISKRDFQNNKVDIVHKYNREQINLLISEKKLSNILLNYYSNMKNKYEENEETNIQFTIDNNSYSSDNSDNIYNSNSHDSHNSDNNDNSDNENI